MNSTTLEKILRISAQICRMHAEEAGTRICQDWSGATDVLDSLTAEERDQIMMEYEAINSNGHDFEPGYFPYDEMLLSFVIARQLEMFSDEVKAADF